MMPEMLTGARTLLNNDTTLQGASYLGAVGHVYVGWRSDVMALPCMTITENNESSTPRPCYGTFKHRDAAATIQVDIWVSMDAESGPTTPDEVELLATRVDELLIGTGLTNTRGWRRVSESPTSPDPDAPRELHKALRYAFEYSQTDT